MVRGVLARRVLRDTLRRRRAGAADSCCEQYKTAESACCVRSDDRKPFEHVLSPDRAGLPGGDYIIATMERKSFFDRPEFDQHEFARTLRRRRADVQRHHFEDPAHQHSTGSV